MTEPEIRELSSLEDLRAVSRLLEEVWGERSLIGVEMLRAIAAHGGEILGASVDHELIGAQVAFLGRRGEELILHSHATGVVPGRQHAGIGTAMKWAQRDWALARGIETVTWTFDPMIARNAYVNLHKLGARAEEFHRNFYGEMADAINAGERTDRLEVVWRLGDPEVVRLARAGAPRATDLSGASPILRDEGGEPVLDDSSQDLLALRIPPDYLALREEDPGRARGWRNAAAEALGAAFDRGYAATGFDRERSTYLLERS